MIHYKKNCKNIVAEQEESRGNLKTKLAYICGNSAPQYDYFRNT